MKPLDGMQQSALCELGNIGSGHAATALAEIVGRRVMVSVPNVWVASPSGLLDGIPPGAPMLGAYFKVLGEPEGGILFALTRPNACKLLDLTIGKQLAPVTAWGAVEETSFKEAGLILCAAYLTALNQLMQLRLIPSVPRILAGKMTEVLRGAFEPQLAACEGTVGVLNEFLETTTKLQAFFVFVPEPEGLALMLDRLGVAK